MFTVLDRNNIIFLIRIFLFSIFFILFNFWIIEINSEEIFVVLTFCIILILFILKVNTLLLRMNIKFFNNLYNFFLNLYLEVIFLNQLYMTYIIDLKKYTKSLALMIYLWYLFFKIKNKIISIWNFKNKQLSLIYIIYIYLSIKFFFLKTIKVINIIDNNIFNNLLFFIKLK